MQVIVLRFDYASSSRIETMQEQGKVASLKNETSLPPHITLQSFSQTKPLDLKKAIEPWAELFKQLPIAFASLGFFKQKGTFYLSPVITHDLADLHRSLNLSTREFTGQDSLYLPDSWVPHVTVMNNVAAPFWGPLFARLALEFEPFNGTATAIECWSISEGRAQTEWSVFLSE
ncbi:2'-5' RNA ligase family protein [Planomicrobium sp. CPCC 101110]|uniref:2'-5' RNA ligase family protein n=1 Tax=Planomicrobium sp. CPCC 101110 TaxID=2599619 RepID=UPI0011B4BAD1|nr:2'-5' RNA ligase family protein [Planomicrobium sp. CPCC 101110]TWT28007.1 2'-5' RNA ligase family protein [Planomicrobium sp. CPCC 101110]